MIMRRIVLLPLAMLVAVLWAGLASVAPAQEDAKPKITVDQIVAKANEVAYYAGKDGRADVSMVITDSQKRERERRFIVLRRDDPPPKDMKLADFDSYCGDQRLYVYFRRPADVNKMVFMVHKHVGKDDKGKTKDDDRWLYLPALDNVKRIAASDRRTSFVGSDFFYEDVSGRNIDEDTHELVEMTENYYVLKNVPKDPKSVEFGSFTTYIHRKTFVMVKVVYLDKKGKKYREYDALKVKEIQGHQTVTESRMKDLRTDSQTVLTYSDVKYDIGLPEDIFTERYLRSAPVEYLRKK